MGAITVAVSALFDSNTSIGAMVMLPIGLFLVGLVFRVKPGQAFANALRAGIGYFGLIVMLSVASASFVPLAGAFAAKTGLALSIPDVGVGLHFPIAFALPAAAFMIPLGMLVNVAMLAIKATKTVDIDVWNFWTWMFSWACVQGLTGSAFFGFLAFVFTGAVSLVLGDLQAKYIERSYGMPGVSFPHAFSSFFGLMAWPFMWLFDRIPGLKDWEADVESLQKKIGPFGNSTVLGFVFGFALSLAAGYDISKAFQTGIIASAILLIMPEMIKNLMAGIFPISEAARAWLTKCYPGKEFYIGLDCAMGVTQPSAIVVGVLLIPITLVLAAIMPGNKLLPLADLAFLGFWVAMPMAMFRNNIIKGVLFGTIAIAASLWMASSMAPLVTRLGAAAGAAIPDGASGVSMLTVYPWGWVTAWFASLFAGGL